jgi:hypothetical protein
MALVSVDKFNKYIKSHEILGTECLPVNGGFHWGLSQHKCLHSSMKIIPIFYSSRPLQNNNQNGNLYPRKRRETMRQHRVFHSTLYRLREFAHVQCPPRRRDGILDRDLCQGPVFAKIVAQVVAPTYRTPQMLIVIEPQRQTDRYTETFRALQSSSAQIPTPSIHRPVQSFNYDHMILCT